MWKINDKTVKWVTKIMREDARKNVKKDNPALGYLPAAIRVRERLTKSFLNIPKKDLHDKNSRAIFLVNAMDCADTILKSFDSDWNSFGPGSYQINYEKYADDE